MQLHSHLTWTPLTGTIDSYQAGTPATGLSTINLDLDLKGDDNAYENGRIEIAGIGTFNVVSNTDNTFVGDDVVIEGTPGTGVIGASFKIYDDDDRFLSTIGLPPALPRDDDSTNIVREIRDVFFPAYIYVTNANAEGLNTSPKIPFKMNEEIGSTGNPFDANKNVHENSYFWAHTIAFGYQTKGSEDRDPDTEDPTYGITSKAFLLYQGGTSAIYEETIRETGLGGITSANFQSTNSYSIWRKDYTNFMAGIIAHEIGHAPGGQSASADHAEAESGDIMYFEGTPLHNSSVSPATFKPVTLKRFRKASQWSE